MTQNVLGPSITIPGATRKDYALAGTLAVCLLLAGSKWAAYIGFPPVFLTDILLICATINLLVSRVFTKRLAPERHSSVWMVPLVILLIWSMVRLILGGEFNLLSARDFAPYMYAFIGLLAGVAFQVSSGGDRRRTNKLIWISLLVHAGWAAFAQAFPQVSLGLPMIGDYRIFRIRTDVDGAILGITAAVALFRWGQIRGSANLIIAFICLILIFPLTSRAGLLGGFLAVALVLIAILQSRDRPLSIPKRQFLIFLTPAIIVVILLVIPQTTVGSRLLTTFDQSSVSQIGNGRGTTEAREDAWSTLTEYIIHDPSRAILGVGFGPDFMMQSGATYELLGVEAANSSEVRSPHNYYLGTWARLGIIGLAIVAGITVLGFTAAWRLRIKFTDQPLLATAACIVVGLTPPAALGVVLESPFGAVPYYWAVGILLSASSAKIFTSLQSNHLTR